MLYTRFFRLSLLAAACAAAASIAQTAHAADAATTPLAIQHHIQHPAQHLDPTWSNASSALVRQQSFGAMRIVQMRPILEGLPVWGADRSFVWSEKTLKNVQIGAALVKKNQFRLDETDALIAALTKGNIKGSLLRDPTVEKYENLTVKGWLSLQKDGVRAVYKVRIPTLALADLVDLYIDADTGSVLLRQPVAKFDAVPPPDDAGVEDTDAGDPADDAGTPVELPPAPTKALVFQYAPNANGVNSADLVEVDLQGLLPAEVGGHLRGQYFETFNCCKEYVCLDGSGECEVNQRRCATADDEDPITSELAIAIPTDALPINLPFQGTIHARTVFCTEIPTAVSQGPTGDREAGWFEIPVDQAREQNLNAGLASEVDAFAEVQVYASTSDYFKHIRSVLDDPTFCLGGDSMQCDETGAPVVGEDGLPVRPFHISTNMLFPAINVQDLLNQFGQGRGLTPGNPLRIEDYARLDNAAFVPALQGGPVQIPPEFQALADAFNRPFDSNIYFQGARDFSYDGDVVRHEFTHAIVHAFKPNLLSVFRDNQGSHAEPGAMNEGWADYFSSSFNNDPLTGEYGAVGLGELAIRNADNDKKCPDDIIGEVHADSEPWSGALWEIREAATQINTPDAVKTLDRALLAALALSDDDETMSKQSVRVREAVVAALGDSFGPIVDEAFAKHNVAACERVIDLAEGQSKDLLNLPGVSDVGLTGFAPAPLQFRIEVPAGATAFQVRWTQGAGGLGGLFGGGGQNQADPLAAVVVKNVGPISWQYTGPEENVPAALDKDGNPVAFDPAADDVKTTASAPDDNGISQGSYDVVVDFDPCNSSTYFVQLGSLDNAASLSNIEVVFTTAEGVVCEDTDAGTPEADAGTTPIDDVPGCGCDQQGNTQAGTVAWLSVLMGAGILSRKRRRQNRTL